MTVRVEPVTFTSGDGETTVPSYLATPAGHGPHPTVLILRGVAGPDDGYIEIARNDGLIMVGARVGCPSGSRSRAPDEATHGDDRVSGVEVGVDHPLGAFVAASWAEVIGPSRMSRPGRPPGGRWQRRRGQITALRRAASRYHSALSLGVRFRVSKSTWTSPNRLP